MASQSKSLSSVLRWHPANSHQLTVYIFQVSDGFPAGYQGLSVLPHFQTGQYGLHVIGKSVDSERDFFHEPPLGGCRRERQQGNDFAQVGTFTSRKCRDIIYTFMRGTYLD